MTFYYFITRSRSRWSSTICVQEKAVVLIFWQIFKSISKYHLTFISVTYAVCLVTGVISIVLFVKTCFINMALVDGRPYRFDNNYLYKPFWYITTVRPQRLPRGGGGQSGGTLSLVAMPKTFMPRKQTMLSVVTRSKSNTWLIQLGTLPLTFRWPILSRILKRVLLWDALAGV